MCNDAIYFCTISLFYQPMTLFFTYVLSALYIVLMLLYRYGWYKQKRVTSSSNYVPKTSISVVIPARNEEENIGECVASILAQDYPAELLEIIVVDDASTDATYDIVSNIETDQALVCIKMLDKKTGNSSYKKQALSLGINSSRGHLIVTTDADTVRDKNWLKSIAKVFEEEQPVMIVGPVNYSNNSKLVEVFQSLDFLSMQGITVASLQLKLGNMSNGANLAFSRHAFEEVKGYEDIDHIASGDDYLLMTKMNKAFPDKISFLKSAEAIVSTAPQPNWKSFLQQRIRWASKSGKYNDLKLTSILLLVYVYNVTIFCFAIATVFFAGSLIYLFLLLTIKSIFELYYLYPVSKFYKKSSQVWLLPLFQPLHITYIVIAGFLGFVGKYKWKGREVS